MTYDGHSPWADEKDGDDYITNPEANHADYHGNEDYGGSPADDYNKIEDDDEGIKRVEDEDQKDTIEENIKGEETKYNKGESEATDDDVKTQAAGEVFVASAEDAAAEKEKKSKNKRSIEDAINKAIKDEKELIYVDD